MSGLSRYGTPGDVRSFYAQLGVELPGWSRREAPVRCFADPESHARGDRDPSCSVNLASGAWSCHGCGSSGGAYDAALLHGRNAREAIDLMIDCGLTQRRDPSRNRTGTPRTASQPARRPRGAAITQPRSSKSAPGPRASEPELAAWARRLLGDQPLLDRLARGRAWSEDVIERHGVGWDGTHIILPVRDLERRLVAVARYAPPWLRGDEPKLRALPGSRQYLFPSPAALKAPTIWIVEGHPDALAALSVGLHAMAVPGVWGWSSRWAPVLADRDVIVCMDCDAEGRRAAMRISADLIAPARTVRVLDLDPDRDDGYDLTDLILELRQAGLALGTELPRRAFSVEPR